MKLTNSRKPLISVVIRSYNEEWHIGTLLKKVFEQELNEHFEVIVVDSGSIDGTTDIINKFPIKLVKIKPEEFSFGYSLNKGIKASQGKYLIFISAHCYPENKHWLKNITAPFEDKEIGLVYGKQRGNGLTKFSEHQIFYKMFPEESVERQGVPFCNNANCAIRRSLWEKIPYDEDLTGLEDIDWAEKIIGKGFWISYCADAGIIHVHDETWPKIFRRYEREAIALVNIFPGKRFTFFAFLRMFVFKTFSDYAQALKSGERLNDIWEIFMFRLMQSWGTYVGINRKGSVFSDLKRKFYSPSNGGGKVGRDG